jgi:hypothetical protein
MDGRGPAGQREVGAAAQLVAKRRVLDPGERAARRHDRLLAGELERLADRDVAMAVAVRRAEQARGQEVSEERAADVVGSWASSPAALEVRNTRPSPSDSRSSSTGGAGRPPLTRVSASPMAKALAKASPSTAP